MSLFPAQWQQAVGTAVKRGKQGAAGSGGQLPVTYTRTALPAAGKHNVPASAGAVKQ